MTSSEESLPWVRKENTRARLERAHRVGGAALGSLAIKLALRTPSLSAQEALEWASALRSAAEILEFIVQKRQ